MSTFRRMMNLFTEERSLTVLLAFLVVQLVIVVPASHLPLGITVISDVFLSLLLMSALLTVMSHRVLRVLGTLLLVATFAARWAALALGEPWLRAAAALLMVPSLVLVLFVVLAQVNRPGPVTAHRIRGAVAGYLLLAVLFGYAYAFIEAVHPGSFQTPAWLTKDPADWAEGFFYFSVVTLTTLGYGDITAIHPVARSLVMTEALIGLLYPAILIARLVTLEMETRQAGKR